MNIEGTWRNWSNINPRP